jgi:hypothetical protein
MKTSRIGAAPRPGVFARFATLVAFVVAAQAIFAGVARADLSAYAAFASENFGTIDLNTGVFSSVGSFGFLASGLGVYNNTIYTVNAVGNGNLYIVNPANAAVTQVGATSSLNYDDFGSTLSGLYAVDSSANLYSLNPSTGVPTLIGSTGLTFGDYRGLSANSSALYFANGPDLYTLNTSTGAATLIGGTGGPEFVTLLTLNGTLYGGQDYPTINIDTLNANTGMATVGPAIPGNNDTIIGLAPIPEPSTLSLLSLGALGLLSRRRAPAASPAPLALG